MVGAVALTGKQYSAILRPTAQTLDALREKHGDIEPNFRAITGYGFDALTESEARYLTNFKPAEQFRVRIADERSARGSKEDQGNPGAGVTPLHDTQQPPSTATKIGDFGEKIGGARKDAWSGFADRLSEAENFDVAKEPLSKTWPEPAYEKMIEDGADPWSVAFIRAARDAIPRKPTTAWKVEQWTEQVIVLRRFARDLISGKFSRADVEDKMKVGGRAMNKIAGAVSLVSGAPGPWFRL